MNRLRLNLGLIALLLTALISPPLRAQQDTDKKAEPAAPVAKTDPAPAVTSNSEKGLRMNFRGVPLDMVLNYLSDAAGFIIILETEVRGKVDVWRNQPLSKDEAVSLLNSILSKNGYAALQSGRTLTIVRSD